MGCSPVVVAQSDTASRLVSGLCPMNARATAEVIVTEPELRTFPVMVIGALGTAIVGVMVVSEMVRGEDDAATEVAEVAEVADVAEVTSVTALAMGTGREDRQQ